MRIFCILLIVFYHTLSKCNGFLKDSVINITLNSNYTFGKQFLYKEVHLPLKSQTTLSINYNFDSINVTNENFSYAIIQVHSFLYNVSLSYESQLMNGNHYNGTNLGLTISLIGSNSELFVFNLNNVEVKAAIVAMLYEKNAPIPGGCSNTNLISPFLEVHYNHDIIEVIAPEASESLNQSSCTDNHHGAIQYYSRYLYLKKNDLTSETYFDGIRKMININKIKQFGYTAKLGAPASNHRIVYIATPGTGMVFNTVVKNAHGHTAYVPAVSYSCNPIFWQNDCHLFMNSGVVVLLSSILVIIGLIKTFVICYNDELDLFLNCIPLWAYVAYKCSTFFPETSENSRTIGVVMSSILLSIITCIAACAIGLSNVLSLVSKLIFSMVFAGFTMFYLSQNNFFAQNSMYWTCFSGIVIVFLLTMVPLCRVFSFVLSTFLGVFTIVFGIQLYRQSHMLLVLLAHFRRMTNSDYNYANGIWIPDTADYGIIVLAIILIALGITCQKNRTLIFDETSIQNTIDDETAPLITRWTHGSDDVFETPNTNYRFFRKLSMLRKKKRRNSYFY